MDATYRYKHTCESKGNICIVCMYLCYMLCIYVYVMLTFKIGFYLIFCSHSSYVQKNNQDVYGALYVFVCILYMCIACMYVCMSYVVCTCISNVMCYMLCYMFIYIYMYFNCCYY